MRYLVGAQADTPIFGKHFLNDNLVWLRDSLTILGFEVSRNLYDRKLLDYERAFGKRKAAIDSGDDDGTLGTESARSLSRAVVEFEHTVFAEAKTRVIASPVPRRFSIDHLLNSPGAILGKDVFDDLSDLARSDLNDACRCLVFECPTAAAFHILRCVEECLRCMYRAYFPRGNQSRAWGTLSEELRRKRRRPKPDEILLAHLDHLRTRFRNPTDHPEKVFEIEEVEDLVHLSVDIINRCIRDSQVTKRRLK